MKRLFATLQVFTWLSLSYGVAQPNILQQVPTPNPGTSANSLVSVAAANDGTAWAIGSRSGPQTLPLILYFDGSNWVEFPVPPEVTGIAFAAAGSTPHGDVWLSGTRPFSVYEREVFFLRARAGVIDRIDLVLSAGAPLDMSGLANDDVWALTGAGTVIHFDGSEWTESPVPQVFSTLNYPEAIHVAGENDVWVAGYGGNRRGEYQGYVQHWDGSSWSLVLTPVTGQLQTFFRDMSGSAPSDVWIVGDHAAQHLSLRWDGSDWALVGGPLSNTPLAQVVALGPNEVWAAPYSLTPGSRFSYWDGTAWADGPSIDLPGASTVTWRGLVQSGDGDLWAVGSYFLSPSHHTLAARLTAGGATAIHDALPARAIGTLRAHPNPFNPATTIRFRLHRPGAVTLRVFDAQGQLVDTVIPGIWLPAGSHELPYSPSVASGVYFAALQAGEHTSTTRLVLTK